MESLLGGCTARSAFFEEVIIHIIIPIFHPLLCFIFGFYCVPPDVKGGGVHEVSDTYGGGGGANFQVWYW